VTGRLEAGKFPIPDGWNPATDLTPFGALFVGEGGWIHVGRGGFIQGHPAEVLQAPLSQAERARPPRSHHQNWFDAIRTRRPTACPADVGCRSTIVAHLGCIAHWMGRTLTWDPVREEFPGDEAANRWLARAMRSPWRL